MSTRILVMREGRIVSQQSSEEATEESVLSAAII
jgi:ABC-type sugar transport system ATPase subunit